LPYLGGCFCVFPRIHSTCFRSPVAREFLDRVSFWARPTRAMTGWRGALETLARRDKVKVGHTPMRAAVRVSAPPCARTLAAALSGLRAS